MYLALPCAPARSLEHLRPLRRSAAGYTLVELLVVLLLAATLATLAVPAFRELGADARRNARLEELRASLQLARSEALVRGRPVVVCASSDGIACGPGSAWSEGWATLVSSDGRATQPLAASGPDHATSVRATRPAVEFLPTAVAASTATLTVCDARGSRAARSLVVSRTGRIRTSTAEVASCG
jgi:type IV fimbrial biogenesis protein FimT